MRIGDWERDYTYRVYETAKDRRYQVVGEEIIPDCLRHHPAVQIAVSETDKEGHAGVTPVCLVGSQKRSILLKCLLGSKGLENLGGEGRQIFRVPNEKSDIDLVISQNTATTLPITLTRAGIACRESPAKSFPQVRKIIVPETNGFPRVDFFYRSNGNAAAVEQHATGGTWIDRLPVHFVNGKLVFLNTLNIDPKRLMNYICRNRFSEALATTFVLKKPPYSPAKYYCDLLLPFKPDENNYSLWLVLALERLCYSSDIEWAEYYETRDGKSHPYTLFRNQIRTLTATDTLFEEGKLCLLARFNKAIKNGAVDLNSRGVAKLLYLADTGLLFTLGSLALLQNDNVALSNISHAMRHIYEANLRCGDNPPHTVWPFTPEMFTRLYFSALKRTGFREPTQEIAKILLREIS